MFSTEILIEKRTSIRALFTSTIFDRARQYDILRYRRAKIYYKATAKGWPEDPLEHFQRPVHAGWCAACTGRAIGFDFILKFS